MAPHPNAVLFARGALARLALWPALRLAVHASWGGPASAEKQRWLAGVLVDQFEPFLAPPAPTSISALSPPTSPPDAVYIEDILLQIMSDEFDVVLEDGSPAAVARDLVALFGHARAGDDAFVRELEAQAERVRGKLPVYEIGVGSASEDGSDSEWEEDEDEDEDEDEGESTGEPAPPLLDHSTGEEPHVDGDGFTVVKRKGRR